MNWKTEHWESCTLNRNIEYLKNEGRLRDLWDYGKWTNIHSIGVPAGEERERIREHICSMLLIIRKMQSKTTMKYNVRMVVIKKGNR